MQRILNLLLVTIFILGGTAVAQSSGWPGNCSQMDYPMYKTSLLAQYPPGFQPPHPNLGVCFPLDDGDPRLVTIKYVVTGTSNFTCSQTAGDGSGLTYYQTDSSVAGNGMCMDHQILRAYPGPPALPLNCPPIFKPYVTYAQNSSDLNRYYNLVQDSTACNNGVCNTSAFSVGDTSSCFQLANQYHQTQEQCSGKWDSDCAAHGGGGGGGCSVKPMPFPIPQGAITPGIPGVPAPKFTQDPMCGTDPCGCGGGDGYSPILIDIEGEGFHLTSARDGVKFDIGATGTPMQMGWTDPRYHNAFLVLDLNSNGVIDNGRELFGNFTNQPSSEHRNGFIALGLYDQPANGGNEDGVIDQHDAIWSKLRLWIDSNHDGISQPGELYTLDHFGIHSLSFAYKDSRRVDAYGNEFRYKGLVNPRQEHHDARDDHHHDGGEIGRWAYDVFFSTK